MMQFDATSPSCFIKMSPYYNQNDQANRFQGVQRARESESDDRKDLAAFEVSRKDGN